MPDSEHSQQKLLRHLKGKKEKQISKTEGVRRSLRDLHPYSGRGGCTSSAHTQSNCRGCTAKNELSGSSASKKKRSADHPPRTRQRARVNTRRRTWTSAVPWPQRQPELRRRCPAGAPLGPGHKPSWCIQHQPAGEPGASIRYLGGQRPPLAPHRHCRHCPRHLRCRPCNHRHHCRYCYGPC